MEYRFICITYILSIGLVVVQNVQCSSTLCNHSFACVTAVKPTNELVAFTEEDDEPTAIVPVKRVKEPAETELKEGVKCRIEWSDRKMYWTNIIALGKCIIHKILLTTLFV